jgi:hypothetical protein
MAVNLNSLDSKSLGRIAIFLSEKDQRSLRLANRFCHQILENEEQWRKKCKITCRTFVKTSARTYRDHYISWYRSKLPPSPHLKAFQSGKQEGELNAPRMLMTMGIICGISEAIVVGFGSSIYYGFVVPALISKSHHELKMQVGSVDSLFDANTKSIVCIAATIPLTIISMIAGSMGGMLVGESNCGRKFCGIFLGSLRYLQSIWKRSPR